MLVDSPRITDADRAHWATVEHYDDALSRDPRLTTRQEKAVESIREFAAGGDCAVSVSWGKDSVVVAHLAYLADPSIPLMRAVPDRKDNPDSEAVRDAYLATHPDQQYREMPYVWRVPLRGEPGWSADQSGQDALQETLSGRLVTGLRAAESTKRRLSASLGISTRRFCRPILHWPTIDVFAYVHRETLPLHPAYAMGGAGAWPRDKIRVHELGTDVGNIEWERLYYGDVLAEPAPSGASRRSGGDAA